MLLGIVLHASMSFFPVPWAVQDTRQSGLFGLLFVMIHGFRMPLFFLLSGYFTLLVYRRKGLRALLWQRAVRILVPCLLGLVTVLPGLHAVSAWAMGRAPKRPPAKLPALFEAIRAGSLEGVRGGLAEEGVLDRPDPVFQIRPLHWAALAGNVEVVTVLLDAGAPLERGDGQGNVPLNAAAFAGRFEIAELLLKRGASPHTRNDEGRLPVTAADMPVDWTLGAFDFLGLPRPGVEALLAGRKRVHELLDPLGPAGGVPADHATATRVGAASDSAVGWLERVVRDYTNWVRSDRWQIRWRGRPVHLVLTGVFDHLWFLWFLCWMVVGFAGVAVWGGWSDNRLPAWAWWGAWGAVLGTVVAQAFMNADQPGFGPDTATGWLIPPHLLVYYGLFYLAGCLMYASEARFQRWTARWPVWLGVSLLVLLPLGLVTMGSRGVSAVLQPAYTWLMCLGCLGLFERTVAQPSGAVRYLSDSSYWLYVSHMPLVIGLQSWVAPWNAPAWLKFGVVLLVALPILLLSYHVLVRPTPLGWLLNGRREPLWGRRPASGPGSASAPAG